MPGKKPKLIVFDLDYTLWPFWVDTHVEPPFNKDRHGTIVDSCGKKVKCYSEVPDVLKKLHDEGYILGVASRSGELKGANQLIQLLNWSEYFTYKEIYPGCKVTHFNSINKKSSIKFKDMLFFDDEGRNIMDLKNHGVTSILVKDGITHVVIEKGLEQFANEHPIPD